EKKWDSILGAEALSLSPPNDLQPAARRSRGDGGAWPLAHRSGSGVIACPHVAAARLRLPDRVHRWLLFFHRLSIAPPVDHHRLERSSRQAARCWTSITDSDPICTLADSASRSGSSAPRWASAIAERYALDLSPV